MEVLKFRAGSWRVDGHGGLLVDLSALLGDKEVFRDYINLASGEERRKFAIAVSERSPISVWEAEERLRKMFLELNEKAISRQEEVRAGLKGLASKLVEMLKEREGFEYFHDQNGDAYVAIRNSSQTQILHLNSKDFKNLIAKFAYSETKKAPTRETINSVLQVLEGTARFEGEKKHLELRTAWHEGSLFYDLGNGKAVKVSPQGWEIVNPPILFYPAPGEQTTPERGGDLKMLLPLVNIPEPVGQMLLLVWIVVGLIPDIPRHILAVEGGHGGGKSVLLTFLKKLIDPAPGKSLRPPYDENTLFVQAWRNFALCYDNLTYIPDWLSDAFCRLVTGAGEVKRQLYTDRDVVVWTVKRLIALSGIAPLKGDVKPDLMDRVLRLDLETITEERRRSEKELEFEFEKIRPFLLGSMFDALSTAMRIKDNFNFRLPRMADWFSWGAAVAEALGYGVNEFEKAYKGKLTTLKTELVSSSPMGTCLLAMAEDKQAGEVVFEGTAFEFHEKLKEVAFSLKISEKELPKNASWVGRKLREMIPSLKEVGLEVDMTKESKTKARLITITKSARSPKMPSLLSPEFGSDRTANEKMPSPCRLQTKNAVSTDQLGDGKTPAGDSKKENAVSSPQIGAQICGDGRDGRDSIFNTLQDVISALNRIVNGKSLASEEMRRKARMLLSDIHLALMDEDTEQLKLFVNDARELLEKTKEGL